MAEGLTPAFVLHRRPYRNSSALLELLSLDEGRVGVVARGVSRPRNRLGAALRPFVPLLVKWTGRGDLGTLQVAEESGPLEALPRDRLVFGLYLNELLVKLLGRHDPVPELFACYQTTISLIASGQPVAAALRRFERDLLADLGVGLVLRQDSTGRAIDPSSWYGYDPEAGPYPVPGMPATQRLVRGTSLISFSDDHLDHANTLRDALVLTRLALDHQLGGRPLRSRELLQVGKTRPTVLSKG